MTGMVYVIIGVVGEYSDRAEWAVKAYSSEARARAEVERMDAVMVGLESRDASCSYFMSDDDPLMVEARAIDPRADQYCGTWPRYCVAAVELDNADGEQM